MCYHGNLYDKNSLPGCQTTFFTFETYLGHYGKVQVQGKVYSAEGFPVGQDEGSEAVRDREKHTSWDKGPGVLCIGCCRDLRFDVSL